MNSDNFSSYHPCVNFLYFTAVIGFAMIIIHPVCIFLSFVCSLSYSVYINKNKAIKFNLKYMLPMLIITALMNPMFNHEGSTILTYLSNGNPLTLESVLYGIAASFVLISVIGWFSCFNAVITSDKLVYLFGRVIPALSLVLSMALRLVPRFKAQIKVISNSQKCIGRDVSNGNIINRIAHGIRILSIMVTWTLENAIETADSMKCRGYGLKGRSAFSIYRFCKRDIISLGFILFFTVYIIAGLFAGGLYWRFFPTTKGVLFEIYSISIYMCYFTLCIIPLIINIREDMKWRSLQ